MHGPKRLIQRLHQRNMIIYRTPDDTVRPQVVRRAEEPQIPQREGLLDHCGTEEGKNARGRCNLQRYSKGGQETSSQGTGAGDVCFGDNLKAVRS